MSARAARKDPSHVRLVDRLVVGCLADIDGSGWSISGYAVEPFPEDQEAARYVRQQLRTNNLEEADQQEFDEQRAADREVADQNHYRPPRVLTDEDNPSSHWQEQKVRETTKVHHDKLRTRRTKDAAKREAEDNGTPEEAPEAPATPEVPTE